MEKQAIKHALGIWVGLRSAPTMIYSGFIKNLIFDLEVHLTEK
jgi:hypothetical protein